MKKYLLITGLIVLFCAIESALFNVFSEWVVPNLLLMFIILLGLFFDLKYSIFSAIIGGLIKDSFSSSVIGVNMVAFLSSVFILFLLRKYVYHPHSGLSRIFVLAAVLTANEFIHFVFYYSAKDIVFAESFKFVILPQIISSIMLYPAVFYIFKKCVLR